MAGGYLLMFSRESIRALNIQAAGPSLFLLHSQG